MKNIFQFEFYDNKHEFVFDNADKVKESSSAEVNEIKEGQALNYSREEQNKLGATIGTYVDLKELKGEVVNVRVVQKNDSVSAITLGFKESGLLN